MELSQLVIKLSKNKSKNGCGCSFLWMYKWLPDFCFTQACNIHDIEIKKTVFKSSLNLLKNMLYSIKVYNKNKIFLTIVAYIYFINVFLFGWIFHFAYKIKNVNR